MGDGHHDLLDARALQRDGEAASTQQLAHLRAQLLLAGEAQRGEQAEPDRLAVAVAPVAGGGLDRVTDGVPEVEHLATAAVALVLGDDRELQARAGEDRALVGRDPGASAPTRSHSSPPAISAVFSTSTQPTFSSARGSVRSVSGSTSTAAGWW